MSLRLHHTFLKLPGPGFSPRPLDPRIGFIPRWHFDHAARWNEPIEKYVAFRWRLVKKDPNAALSEPVEPIVYYLDRGIPIGHEGEPRAVSFGSGGDIQSLDGGAVSGGSRRGAAPRSGARRAPDSSRFSRDFRYLLSKSKRIHKTSRDKEE